MFILLILILIAAGVFIHLQPSEMQVTRNITIAATPDKIFPLVNDLHAWDAWSPWAKLDPVAKNTFEGPSAGVGAIMRWVSTNSKVGEGSMKITQSTPSTQILIQLEFIKPMPGNSISEFIFTPDGSTTRVSWNMQGSKNFIMKGMGLVINCDKMVGEQFEKGLVSLKGLAEA